MGKYNKKNNNKTITVKEAKHDLIVFLITFTFLSKLEQIKYIEKFIKDGWL